MKRFIACLSSLLLAISFVPVVPFAYADDAAGGGAQTYPQLPDVSLSNDFTARSVGIGGHGAAFDAVISPFDSDTIVCDCDMGGVYVTHDAGKSWNIKNCGGRIWDMQADPNTEGTFYATGSGLWRSTDNGDTWNLLWPDPSKVNYTPTKLNHTRTYYFTSDSYPDAYSVATMQVDPSDSDHLVALASETPNYADSSRYRYLFESFDRGANFTCIAQFKQAKAFPTGNFEHSRIFIEHGSSSQESRIVMAIPDGIYEVDRCKTPSSGETALDTLYAAPATIEDAKQVVDTAGTHYVVVENVDDATADALGTRTKIWHTSNFADPNATVDLTEEFVNSLPRYYNMKSDRNGESGKVIHHCAAAISAPSLDLMYVSYRVAGNKDLSGKSPTWQGLAGLVTYDASRPAGSRFQWTYGVRPYWTDTEGGTDKPTAANTKRLTPDANCLMERAHADASYALFNVAVDPRNSKAIALTTHTGLMYSPDISVQGRLQSNYDAEGYDRYYKVNMYPRYAVKVGENPVDDDASLAEDLMRSYGLEVTVAERVAVDPFDTDHILIGYDDAGVGQSFDGGQTFVIMPTKYPSGIRDTMFDAVFDEGKQGTIYSLWSNRGGSLNVTVDAQKTASMCFATSTDGGKTWSVGSGNGLPAKGTAVRLAVDYPRDRGGDITDGERTIYVAMMGSGFYVSHDSGKHFEPMNDGISKLNGDVWARDILLTEDGRLFGITQYSDLGAKNANGSSTYHSTQQAESFGNVWEWDESAEGGAGAWVRLPLNTVGDAYNSGLQVRQPRDICYNPKTRTLYVAAVSVIGKGYTTGPSSVSGVSRWDNLGGGLYAYTSEEGATVGSGTATELAWVSELLGKSRNLTGVDFDAAGRLWIATEDGDVYCRSKKQVNTQVCSKLFCLSQDFTAAPDGTVYFTTRGTGTFRIDPVESAESPSATFDDEDRGAGGGSGNAGSTSSSQGSGRLVDVAELDVALSQAKYAYNGKARRPAVVVKHDGRELSADAYSVAYARGCKKVGTYKVTVSMKGSYTGTKTLSFMIVPKATKLKKTVRIGKKGFTATWRKQAKQVTGYQLQYAKKRNFKGAKTVTVPKAKTTRKQVKKLAPKTKYWLRIRTYKKVAGKKYYSTWSKPKSVKTR